MVDTHFKFIQTQRMNNTKPWVNAYDNSVSVEAHLLQ